MNYLFIYEIKKHSLMTNLLICFSTIILKRIINKTKAWP